MFQKISSLFLVSAFFTVSVSAYGGDDYVIDSPEKACFVLLNQSMANSAHFRNVDLTKVQKKTKLWSSDFFDVSTYESFLSIANIAVPSPLKLRHLQKFPKRMNRVPASEKGDSNITYKANRANIGTIMYTDGSSTDIGPFVAFGDKSASNHTIDGYFLDSKVVTFGHRVALQFPYTNRDTRSSRKYPFGRPYEDMREYILYTHTLAPHRGRGEFLSCGIVKISPDGDYSRDTISQENYNGNIFEGSGYTTRIKSLKGYDFREGVVRVQGVDKLGASGYDDAGDPFLYFDVITLAYNNGSSFHNEYITLEMQKNAMTAPDYQAQGLWNTINKFYDTVISSSGLGIAGGSDANSLATVAPQNFLASLIDTPGKPRGGLAWADGVPYRLVKEIEKIEDEALRQYLLAALTPGYREVFERKNPEELTEFEEAFLNCPIQTDERVKNIEYLISVSGGGEKVSPNKLSYLDLDFGKCVIPFMDYRETEILNTPILKDASMALTKKLEEKLALNQSKAIQGGISSEELQALSVEMEKFESDISLTQTRINELESKMTVCRLDGLDQRIDFERGNITSAVFEKNITKIKYECNNIFASYVEEFGLDLPVSEISLEDIRGRDFVDASVTKISNSTVWWKRVQRRYELGALFLMLLGIGILVLVFRPKSS